MPKPTLKEDGEGSLMRIL